MKSYCKDFLLFYLLCGAQLLADALFSLDALENKIIHKNRTFYILFLYQATHIKVH